MARPALTPESLSRESDAYLKALNEGTDLACVLLAGSYLDQCLGTLLQALLIDDRVSHRLVNGPLKNFAARITAAHALGLIPEDMRANLDRVREVRNHFAHSHFEVTFSTAEVSRLCEQLTFPKVRQWVVVGGPPPGRTGAFDQHTSPRDRFSWVSLLMSQRLLLTAMATERRAVSGSW